MANQNSFTADEWAVLCDTPHLVGLAVALSGASGITGTIKETFASSLAVAEGQKSENELIRALCANDAIQAAQAGVRESLMALKGDDFAVAQQKLATLALDRARAAVTALQSKAPGDLAAYRSFLAALAERVAQAAKEGGFLGFGGERVSEGEKQMLAKLEAALGGSR